MAAPYPPGPQQMPYQQAPRGNGLAVAALVCGIVGVVLFFIVFIGPLLGLLAVIFGAIGISKANKVGKGKGLAITGLILGVLAVLVGVLFQVVIVAAFVDYAKKGKRLEANLVTHQISQKLKMYYMDRSSLPKSMARMPAADGCVNGKVGPVPHSAWDAAGWNEIDFAVDEASPYTYEWQLTSPTSGKILARDCDGAISTEVDVDATGGNIQTTEMPR